MNYYTAVSPFWLVAVSVCRRSGLLLIAVSPFWFVAVLVSPFWRVAVLVCRRFDHRPPMPIDGYVTEELMQIALTISYVLQFHGSRLPGVRQNDFLACSGSWRHLRLLHRHQIADVRQHSLQIRHCCQLPQPKRLFVDDFTTKSNSKFPPNT